MVSEPTIMDPVANNPSPLLLLNNMSNLMSIKLDSMNYMLWKLQISAILDAYSMIEHLDGSTQQPRQFIITEDGDQTLNPAFLIWRKKGQGITDLASFNTVFSSTCHGCGINHISRSLEQNTRDKLSAVGVLVDNEELLHMILKGLPKEFAPFASAIRTRDDSISFEKLSVLLQTEEQSMAVASESFSNSALAMFVSNNHKPNNGFNGGQGYNRGRGRNSFNRGRGGRSFNSYPSQHQTQLPQSSNPISQPSSQPGSMVNLRDQHVKSVGRLDTMQLIATIGWILPIKERIHQLSLLPWPMHLTSITLKILRHGSLTSGASDHITANASTLNTQTPYQGTEQVTVGNGQNLPIQSIVHKLCLDNNCSCHFDAHKLLIQDLPTGRLLYKGLSKDGVYPINSSQFCTSASSKTACLCFIFCTKMGALAFKTRTS
uniref:Retrotransposon Copia-like N-terminal domain-containing protein n=1 Tax=Fagus sylvatica TaxID=28930 RepID=A0A2N9JAC3_FAGSY